MKEVTEADFQKIHDLITSIKHQHDKMERDIDNLYNLIHVIEGVGIRNPAFIAKDEEGRKKPVIMPQYERGG